jgi:predicted ATP-dependent endonuclease of OLD family
VKTLLAIGRKAKDAHIVLLEEPENHLSFSSLRSLITKIEAQCEDKQVIMATHSSFVLNKLGMDKLILLGDGSAMKLTELPDDTASYFKRLSGYDTLRLVLAKRAILVEGPSDDLVVQRAYMDLHGKLPIEDGIDVISVGLSFARFLDIARRLKVRTSVVTDNDGKDPKLVEERYSKYAVEPEITVHVGDDQNLRTLEPQLLAANDLATLNAILGTNYDSDEELLEYMADNKTACALAIFETDQSVTMPKYILDAIAE